MDRASGPPTAYCSVDDVRASAEVLRDPGDLVVAAGGDGSVHSVGQALMGRRVPMTILPMGTANNVATHLGLVGDLWIVPDEDAASSGRYWSEGVCELTIGITPAALTVLAPE